MFKQIMKKAQKEGPSRHGGEPLPVAHIPAIYRNIYNVGIRGFPARGNNRQCSRLSKGDLSVSTILRLEALALACLRQDS